MRTPYGLEIIESCLICPLRHDRIFCDLPLQDLEALQAMSSLATYPKGSILFVEGQESRGVFILCNGRVKLSAGTADGKSLIMRIAESGEIIGLPGTISGRPYEVTAEALEPRRNLGSATVDVPELLTFVLAVPGGKPPILSRRRA